MELKRPGNLLLVVGATDAAMGGSHLAMRDSEAPIDRRVPRVNLEECPRQARVVATLLARETIVAVHDCSDGGLAVCLAETAFAGNFGLRVNLGDLPAGEVESDAILLFSESPCRIVLTVPRNRAEQFERSLGNRIAQIGEVIDEPTLEITGINGNTVIEENIDELRKSWQTPMGW